jgi:hypothetical protein
MASSFNDTCPVVNQEFSNANYEPPPFQNTISIGGFHNGVPRFGHSNNMSVLIDGSNAEMKDYLVGLTGASIIIFAVIFVWALILLVLKCMGYRLVGWLSGHAVTRPSRPLRPGGGEMELYEKEVQEWKRVVRRRERRLLFTRITCLLACVFIIVSAVLMCVKGIAGLQGSVNEGRSMLQQGDGLAIEAIDMIDTYRTRQDAAFNDVKEFRDDSNVVCPNVRAVICTDSSLVETCDFSDIPFGNEMEDAIIASRTILLGEMEDARSDLLQLSSTLQKIDQTIGRYTWAFYVAAGFVILLAIITFFVSLGIIDAWRGKVSGTCMRSFRNCLRSWIILPIFIFFVIMCWIFSMVFVIGTVASADVCYGSPDGLITVSIFLLPIRVSVSLMYSIRILLRKARRRGFILLFSFAMPFIL